MSKRKHGSRLDGKSRECYFGGKSGMHQTYTLKIQTIVACNECKNLVEVASAVDDGGYGENT
jgi:hypothetical protein